MSKELDKRFEEIDIRLNKLSVDVAKFVSGFKKEIVWTKIGDLEWSDCLGKMNWNDAVKRAEEIGGRLPKKWEMEKAVEENYKELQELIESDEDSYFWSATENSATGAWTVNLVNGSTFNHSKSTPSYQVRCVRVVD